MSDAEIKKLREEKNVLNDQISKLMVGPDLLLESRARLSFFLDAIEDTTVLKTEPETRKIVAALNEANEKLKNISELLISEIRTKQNRVNDLSSIPSY